MLRRETETLRNRKEMTIKPMRMYKDETNINYDDVEEGDLIVATVTNFFPPSAIYLCVGEITATMVLSDFHHFPNDDENQKLRKSAHSSIGKKVLARVKSKVDGMFILERNSVIRETIKFLAENIGTTIDATIESIANCGVFVDIGNGFLSLLVPKEMSKMHIYNFEKKFEIGERIKVKIMDYDAERDMISISRKQAYERLGEEKMTPGSEFIVTCGDYVYSQYRDGVFIEFDPNNTGIMDIPIGLSLNEFYYGRKVAVTIKKHKDVGFQATFNHFI